MPITIKIKLLNDDYNMTEHEIKFLIMDALYEFQMSRTPAEAYVNKRYPDNEDYAWLNRTKKVKEVERRCKIAEQIRNGHVELELTGFDAQEELPF